MLSGLILLQIGILGTLLYHNMLWREPCQGRGDHQGTREGEGGVGVDTIVRNLTSNITGSVKYLNEDVALLVEINHSPHSGVTDLRTEHSVLERERRRVHKPI